MATKPRTLNQILSELNPIYNPQINSIKEQQAGLPAQVQAEQQGLAAKQEEAFGDILGGARRRGLGFSGIPLGEQAKYSATEYMPALARLNQSRIDQERSLSDAILGIQERRGTLAQQLRQTEEDRYAQILENEKNRQAQLKAAQIAASPSFGFNPSASTGGAGGSFDEEQSKALSDVQKMIDRRKTDPNSFLNEMIAINKSAGYGNTYDRAKLQLLQQYQPGYFQNGKLNTGRISQLRSVYSPSIGSSSGSSGSSSGIQNTNALGQPLRLLR